jgi:hypothetical protein
MNRVGLLILALLAMDDLAEDGCLGKAKFVPLSSAAKTSITSSYHPDPNQTNFQDEIAATDLQRIPCHEHTQARTCHGSV